MRKYEKYIKDVEHGRIVVSNNIRLSVKRFQELRHNRSDIYFDERAVDTVINFIATCKHFKGKHANKPFILEPWQEFIVAYLYGLKYVKNNLRVIKKSYIEMARKNGKTAFIAALSLYHLIADGENGAEVYFAANSRDQVKKAAWPLTSNFANSLDPKWQYLTKLRDSIPFNMTKSNLQVLAADSSTLDGLDTSFFCLDEYHAAKNSSLYEVLNSSMTNRTQPLHIIITTAGFDKNGPCYKERTVAVDILNGVKNDDRFAIFIFSLDEGDDWMDKNVWVKSNPNYGVTVTEESISDEVTKAVNNTSLEVGVRTKTINQWCDSSTTWIREQYLTESTKNKVDLRDFKYETCYIGVDLAAVSDLTAVSCLVVKDGKYYFKNYAYLPSTQLEESENKHLYKEFQYNKELIVCPGNVTDYNTITRNLLEINDLLYIDNIYYDKWNATQWAIDATNEGLPIKECAQSTGAFNRPTKELERLMLSGNVIIDNTDITRYCFRNVELAIDMHGNIKPDKAKSKNKIDIVIAMIQALQCYLDSDRYEYTGI